MEIREGEFSFDISLSVRSECRFPNMYNGNDCRFLVSYVTSDFPNKL